MHIWELGVVIRAVLGAHKRLLIPTLFNGVDYLIHIIYILWCNSLEESVSVRILFHRQYELLETVNSAAYCTEE